MRIPRKALSAITYRKRWTHIVIHVSASVLSTVIVFSTEGELALLAPRVFSDGVGLAEGLIALPGDREISMGVSHNGGGGCGGHGGDCVRR